MLEARQPKELADEMMELFARLMILMKDMDTLTTITKRDLVLITFALKEIAKLLERSDAEMESK